MDIVFNNVSYIYQKNTPFAHKAIANLSFYIPSGTYTAIIGHTGSGKSTLIQHLNGLVRPSEGEVTIGNYRLTNNEKPEDRKSTRLNSSHVSISYAVFCLKKKIQRI